MATHDQSEKYVVLLLQFRRLHKEISAVHVLLELLSFDFDGDIKGMQNTLAYLSKNLQKSLENMSPYDDKEIEINKVKETKYS